MDFSRLMASTAAALDKLQRRKQCSATFRDTKEIGIIMHWLTVVRTFVLCSTTLADNVELSIEANNDNAVPSRRSQKKRMKQKKRRMRKDLGSLLVRVEDVVRRILDNRIPHKPFAFQYDLESLKEEMDKWYTRLSDYLRKYSTSPVANKIKVITDSVLENLKYFLSTKNDSDCQFLDHVQLIESVIKNIPFLINFIRFGTLVCAENQEFRSSLAQIELLAIGAAHFSLHLFSNVKGPIPLSNGLTNSIVNPFLHGAYAPALASLKRSQESHNPTPDLNDYPFVTIMEDFVTSLLYILWRMLQSDTVSMASLKDKLQTVYRGLRFLKIILKNQPEKFDDGKIRDTTVAAICDAGVIIFSLDQKDFEISHANQVFSETIQVIRLEVIGYVLKTNFPQTNVLGFLDFLLEDYMAEVEGSKVDSDTLSFVPNIQEFLVFLKSFLGKLLELRNQQENLHQERAFCYVWNLAVEVAYKIEHLIDQLVLGDILDSFSTSLRFITLDIMVLKKADSLNIFDEVRQDIIKVQEITDKVPSIISSAVADEVVGFESEKKSIIDRLLGGFPKLQVVAVVGMPGSGKTTLATKVYKDFSVTCRFHRRAWCSISQVFNRRNVLLELLNQTKDCEIKSTLDENDLSQQLRKSLKGRKYLIFIDDIWDTKAFEFLKESLPDDSNQSRILLTSRHGDVVPGYIPHDKPLLLPLLTDEQSLELLQRKLFPDQKGWPLEFHELGMGVAEYCKGLPLTLVIIAGFLNTKEREGWKDVLKTLRSSTVSDLIVRTIDLSYTHLPDHLKPLFLWFGAFPEDHEISVKEIISLWISEGLVRKFESKSSEEVARDYINILIARGLVMVAGRRSVGGVKTCRVHDLLRDFCLRKANEEFFVHILEVDAKEDQEQLFPDEFETSSLYEWELDLKRLFPFFRKKRNNDLLINLRSFIEPELLSSVELRNMRRLCIYSKPELLKWEVFCPRLRSLLFFATKYDQKLDVSVIFRMFKLLRVLGIGGFQFVDFPSEIGALTQLRYLAIQVDFVGPAIGNLSNLEILILKASSWGDVKLPDTIWKLQKLRHLCIDKRHGGRLILPMFNLDTPCNLVGLETLSILYCWHWSIMKKQLKKFPNIRRLRCWLKLYVDKDGCVSYINEDGYVNVSYIKAVDFSFLSQLDSLFYEQESNKLVKVVFPESVKKLTLLGCKFPWSKMSSVAKLPHLAVLKLLEESFDGETWDFEDEDEEFPNLKFLKLESLNIVKWAAASNHQFPKLEKLVLSYCSMLQEIPEDCIENVATLQAIEVIGCPLHVVTQVRRIEESQKDCGAVLQVHVCDILDDSTDESSKTEEDLGAL